MARLPQDLSCGSLAIRQTKALRQVRHKQQKILPFSSSIDSIFYSAISLSVSLSIPLPRLRMDFPARKKKKAGFLGLFRYLMIVGYMEQGTGVEPAFSAWEADVLPIY